MTEETLQNIVLVEDDTDIRCIAKLALSSVGKFSVQMFESGEELLQNIESVNPQLILLDVMMPKMDGPETLKHLQQIPRFTNIPVIFLTANVQEHEIRHYKKLGATDVISKPFDPMTLSKNILEIWNHISTSKTRS